MRRTQLATVLCVLLWCAHSSAPASHAAISTRAQPKGTIPQISAAASPSCLNDPTIGSKVWTVAISDTLAFLADGQALTTLDISVSSPTKAVLIGSYDPPGFGYDMRVASNFAYLANAESGYQTGDYGFEIIDLSNQANPFLRGWFHNGNTGRFFYLPLIPR